MTADLRESIRDTAPDGSRHYIYPPTGERLVSVTTVLSATTGKPHLVPWAAKLAAEYAIDNAGMLAKLVTTEGRQAAIDLAKRQAEQIRQTKADAGTYVHDVVEALILWSASPAGTGAEMALPLLPDHLEGAEYDGQPLTEVTDWMIDGFINFVSDFGPEFLAAEMPVFNQPLGIAGTLDICAAIPHVRLAPGGGLAFDRDGRVVLALDTKTGRHMEVTWREQVAAYRRMKDALLPMGEMAAVPATDGAGVLHLRPEHERGYRLMLISGTDDEAAWRTFQSALTVYAERAVAKAKPGRVVYAPRADGTMPAPRLADLDGEGYGRTISPLTKAGIADLEQLAAMNAADLLALKGVGGKAVEGARKMLADHGLHLLGEEEQ